MRNDYFDKWLIANGIKKACDRCDGVTESQETFVSKGLSGNALVTLPLIDGCDRCDKTPGEIYSVTPVTPLAHSWCDNAVDLKASDSKGYGGMSHLSHLPHPENRLTEEELIEINSEFRFFGRVKCKYCSNLNFKGICSVDKIRRYRPIQDKWRRCESYISIKQIKE